MKKVNISIVLLLVLASFSFQAIAAMDANTNLASGKKFFGTYINPEFVTDGKITGGRAVSESIAENPQYLTVDLGMNMYLDRVKIYWDRNALSKDFAVRTSSDAKMWYEEASKIDASFGVLDNPSGTMATSISLKRSIISSRYVQIMIPAGSKVNSADGKTVKIAEIEVYPFLNQKLTLDDINAYAPTDNSCLVTYKTSLGIASGSVIYGTDPAKMDMSARNALSGTDNSANLTGLKSRTTYFCQAIATDYYGKTVTSKIINFATLDRDVARNKKVTGTFTNLPPQKDYVTPGDANNVLARITDGKTDYFKSMATSGSIVNSDQYVVIDLGNSYNIKNIVSYWRQLAYPESLTIQVSNNSTDWNTIADGVNAGKGVFSRSDAGDPMMVVNSKGASGRYVKLLVKKGSPFYVKHSDWSFVQLMEVQVFAE